MISTLDFGSISTGLRPGQRNCVVLLSSALNPRIPSASMCINGVYLVLANYQETLTECTRAVWGWGMMDFEPIHRE